MIRNFQTRMVVFFSALFVVVQLLTLAAVYWISNESVMAQLGHNLMTNQRVFTRLLTERGERIASEARVLVADFGFRSAVHDSDPATVVSALENLTYRIRAQRGLYIDLDGHVVADTGQQLSGSAFPYPGVLAEADGQGKKVFFGVLQDGLHEWAVVPVLAPIPIGWVAIALPVDQQLVEHLKDLSGASLEITLVEHSAQRRRIFVSSLPGEKRQALDHLPLEDLLLNGNRPQFLTMGKASYLSQFQALPTAPGQSPIEALLQIDRAATLRPYVLLLYTVAGLLVFGLFAILLGSYQIARKISQPVRDMADATQRFTAGHFDQPIAMPHDDDLRQLAESLNMAGRIATEVGELRQRDQLRRELVADVSHDLRTPLTSLHGYLETMQLKADKLPLEERQRFLAVAVQQSAKLGRLAQELFELAKLECHDNPIELETFCLAELVQDAIQKFDLDARQRGVHLSADLQQELPLVVADIGLIERVLTNLIDNALRHTPQGGSVAVELAQEANQVWVRVADTGMGIAAEYLPKLFQRDSPLGKRPERTSGGLGLIVVARILALHGSRIEVDSTPGIGSTFRFALQTAAAH